MLATHDFMLALHIQCDIIMIYLVQYVSVGLLSEFVVFGRAIVLRNWRVIYRNLPITYILRGDSA